MRQIKFRAKAKTFPIDEFMGRTFENGEWVFGELHITTTGVPHIHTNMCNRITIDTDTIGQFTGMHDKNGKEIYEGDIVESNGDFISEVYFNEYMAMFQIEDMRTDRAFTLYEWDLEIIGNKYDNPELLKEE